MVTVTLFGGVNEVGGNKIFIESKTKKKIFLDFGVPFTRISRYFGFPSPKPQSIKQLIDFGIIPSINGLYSKGVESNNREPIDLKHEPEPPIQGVFISHAHLDHIGYISLLSRKTQIYMGECTRNILDIYKILASRDFYRNYDGLQIKTFISGVKECISNDFCVTPVHVDHSIPGAYGFAVEADGKVVVYTGDLRMHGTKQLTEDFINYVQNFGHIDVLITETTHIDYSGYTSEAEVEAKVADIISRSKCNILVNFSLTDYDRFCSIYEAARKLGAPLLIDAKRALYIGTISSKCPHLEKKIDLSNVYVYIDRDLRKAIRRLEEIIDGYRLSNRILFAKRIVDMRRLSREAREFIDIYLGKSKDQNDYLEDFISERKVVIAVPSMDPSEISRVLHKGDIFILASSEPIGEESEINFERLKNWLEYYGVPIYHIHASGHITPIDLRDMIERIEPKKIIPIHGERPNLLREFIGAGNRWISPVEGQKIII